MANPVAELDIPVKFSVDTSEFKKVRSKVDSFLKDIEDGRKTGLSSNFTKELKESTKEYKELLKSVKSKYDLNQKQAKAIVNAYYGKSLDTRLLEMGIEKKSTKKYSLNQLASGESDYEVLKKMYEKKGYKGAWLTRKINEGMGKKGIAQQYKKRQEEIKEFKNLKEKNKEEKKGMPFLKQLAKLGRVFGISTAGLVGTTLAGAVAYGIGKNVMYDNTVAREKQTYQGYSKALRRTVYQYGGGAEGVEALGGFYNQFYGFKEKLARGMADTSIFERLAKATGDSELIDSLLTDDTSKFFENVLKKASKMKEADAYNLFQALNIPASVGMDLIKDVKSGEFFKTLTANKLKENIGLKTGQASIRAGESIRGLVNDVSDVISGVTDFAVSPKQALESINKYPVKGDIIFNNTLNGDVSAEQIENASRLIDNESRSVNIRNEQGYQGQ